MDMIYVDILTGEICRQFSLQIWTSFIGQFVIQTSSRRKGVDWYLLLVVKQELKINEDELITMGDLMRQRALPSYT